jgi:hypothetical protein
VSERCVRCERGREACEWCHDVGDADWRAICDCGLHDFDEHLIACEQRDAFRFVIVANHESASIPRT